MSVARHYGNLVLITGWFGSKVKKLVGKFYAFSIHLKGNLCTYSILQSQFCIYKYNEQPNSI